MVSYKTRRRWREEEQASRYWEKPFFCRKNSGGFFINWRLILRTIFQFISYAGILVGVVLTGLAVTTALRGLQHMSSFFK